ncbi:hypothetical protein [Amycolatopsis sp. NPDC004079]|uniref:hypothetical protein n=1 Tax=Amycolatopsis sp. NPDC004079 TaxID=3154549 RepID=UPI0033A0BDB4
MSEQQQAIRNSDGLGAQDPREDPIGTVRSGADERYAVKVDAGHHSWYNPDGRRYHHNEVAGLRVVRLDKNAREQPDTTLRAAIADEHQAMELSYALRQLTTATARADAAQMTLAETRSRVSAELDEWQERGADPAMIDSIRLLLAERVATDPQETRR